jgi:adenine-specific DNA-methyltransferase
MQDNSRKANGKYYTPGAVARPLVAWALNGGNGRVLDPSFGGCAFLCAALDELKTRGVRLPGQFICGVDLDERAQHHLGPLLDAGARGTQFRHEDFLRVQPADLGRLFDAVVGNPPYVRHHLLPKSAKSQAAATALDDHVDIPARASYWTYFVVHAARFVAPGGRMAFVLPAAFLYADYADTIHTSLKQAFGDVTLAAIGERVFSDAEEISVVLLAADRGKACDSIRLGWVATADELSSLCRDTTRGTHLVPAIDNDGRWLRWAAGADAFALYERLLAESKAARLGDYAKVRIGTVTGDNSFFTFPRTVCEQRRIPVEMTKPVVTKARDLAGLCHTRRDQRRMGDSGRDCLLLSTDGSTRLPEAVKRYLKTGRQLKVHKTFKCRNRETWHSVPDTDAPGAFLQYMCSDHPKLVLNPARASCTNALHRLWWLDETDRTDPQWLALALLCSLSRLSAELVGRVYGGGLLKLEPSDARRLVVPKPPSETAGQAFRDTDRLLREGNAEEARKAADEALLRSHLRLSDEEIASLAAAAERLRALRRRSAKRPRTDG